jgi:hypothetical protein
MVVERRGGTVMLKSLTEAIKRVQAGTDKTAAELALLRLREEFNNLTAQRGSLASQMEQSRTFGRTTALVLIGLGLFNLIFVSAALGGILSSAGAVVAILVVRRKPDSVMGEKLSEIDEEIARVRKGMGEARKILDS